MKLIRIHDEGCLGILLKSDGEYHLVKYYLDGLSYSALLEEDEFTAIGDIKEIYE